MRHADAAPEGVADRGRAAAAWLFCCLSAAGAQGGAPALRQRGEGTFARGLCRAAFGKAVRQNSVPCARGSLDGLERVRAERCPKSPETVPAPCPNACACRGEGKRGLSQTGPLLPHQFEVKPRIVTAAAPRSAGRPHHGGARAEAGGARGGAEQGAGWRAVLFPDDFPGT